MHLFDANGKEIMPEATEPATPKPKVKAPVKYANYTENGGIAMFASIIVAFCTLLGILTVLVQRWARKKTVWTDLTFHGLSICIASVHFSVQQ